MNYTHRQRLLLQTHNGIVLWKATDGNGTTHYAYIKADAMQIAAMQRAYRMNQAIHFEEYGQVLHCGTGNIPQELHQHYMSDTYSSAA